MDYHDTFLLDNVLPVIQETVDASTILYDLLGKNAKDIRGDYVVWDTNIQMEEGVGARPIRGTLPVPKEADFIQAKLRLMNIYGQMDITGQEKILSERGGPKSREAIAKILTDKSKRLMATFKRYVDFMFWNDGSGTYCRTVGTGSGATTVIVDDIRNIKRGMVIDIHASTPIERTVLTVNKKASSFTIASGTWEDDVVITRYDCKDEEITGLKKVMLPTSTADWDVWGSYATVNRDTNQEFRPWFDHNNSVPEDLTLEIIDDLVFGVQDNDCSNNLVMIAGSALYKAILKLRRDKNQPTKYREMRLGYEAPLYEGPEVQIPIIYAKRTPKWFDNALIILDLNDWWIRRPLPITWKFGNGGYILRVVENTDVERATLASYMEMVCLNPMHSGIRYDLQAPSA